MEAPHFGISESNSTKKLSPIKWIKLRRQVASFSSYISRLDKELKIFIKIESPPLKKEHEKLPSNCVHASQSMVEYFCIEEWKKNIAKAKAKIFITQSARGVCFTLFCSLSSSFLSLLLDLFASFLFTLLYLFNSNFSLINFFNQYFF